MKNGKSALERARYIVWLILMITVILGLLYMMIGIMDIMSAPYTSFPWYSACFYALVYFGPPIAAEGIVYLIITVIHIKRKKKFEKR